MRTYTILVVLASACSVLSAPAPKEDTSKRGPAEESSLYRRGAWGKRESVEQDAIYRANAWGKRELVRED